MMPGGGGYPPLPLGGPYPRPLGGYPLPRGGPYAPLLGVGGIGGLSSYVGLCPKGAPNSSCLGRLLDLDL